MAVLHVVDRVLVVALDGEGQIEGQRRLHRGHDEEEARRVNADLVEDLVERHDLARALAHRDLLAAAHQRDLLRDRDVEASRITQRRGHALEPLDVAVVVGPQDVDDAVAALELLIVIGDVHAEVRRPAVAPQQYAILVVAELRRAEKEGALALVGEPELGQMLDAFAHLAGVVQLAFALPAIVGHAEALRGALLLRHELVASEAREVRQPLVFRRGDPPFAVAVANLPRDRNQIGARISVFGQRVRRVEELPVARVDRARPGRRVVLRRR